MISTLALRPYVFLFVAAFVGAGLRDIGPRRTALFAAVVWPLAWAAEFSSTRTGVPFGLYHYTGLTHGRELYLADVPFMDSLSFTFLAYAAFSLARRVLAGRGVSDATIALTSGVLMMLLDVVIDPLAVRGDRWFLGRVFFYPEGGAYFGVPLSNFLGWVVVGTAGVGTYLMVAAARGNPADAAASGRPAWGVALYYAVSAFNLIMTAWIGEWPLFGMGLTLHAAAAVALRSLTRSGEPQRDLATGEIQSA
ncbi:MAG TPA: carotenoid biosynthesis protein [Methylomirabilota bacterium]